MNVLTYISRQPSKHCSYFSTGNTDEIAAMTRVEKAKAGLAEEIQQMESKRAQHEAQMATKHEKKRAQQERLSLIITHEQELLHCVILRLSDSYMYTG